MEIGIRRTPQTLQTDLFIYERNDDRSITNFSVNERGEMIATRIEMNQGEVNTMKPFATMTEWVMREMLKAFAKHLQDEGFKDAKDSESIGELKATKTHLEDMRRLVFEPTITNVEVKRTDHEN